MIESGSGTRSLDQPTSPLPPATTSAGADQAKARSDQAKARGFPEATLRVRTWPDPVLDSLGHDPRSPYAEQFWLAVLGPSCLFLLRRLVDRLDRHPDGFEIVTAEWAGELGLGMRGGRQSPFWRSVDRACRFRATQRNGDLLVVHRRLPPLTRGQIARLPPHLADHHQRWADSRLAKPTRATITKWSPSRSVEPGAA